MTSDERVERGMRALLELRRRRLEAGERPLGWKVGFGSPAALELLGTSEALVGFMTDRSLVESGSTVSLADYAHPVLEPEIAAYAGEDGAVAALGAAFELADLDASLRDPEAILAGDIFHRGVVLGPPVPGAAAAGVTAVLRRGGEEIGRTDDPQAMTGEIEALVRHVASTLERHGERLRPGEVVITGSVVPPVAVVPGDRIRLDLEPLGSLELAFS